MRRLPFHGVISVVALALATFTLGPSGVAAYEHVTNGGFESGTAGWSASQAQLETVDAAEVDPFEGVHAGKLTTVDGADFRLSQVIGAPLSAGPYALEAHVRGAGATSTVRGVVTLGGASYEYLESPATIADADGWTVIEVPVVAGEGAVLTSISIRGSSAGPAELYVDGVTLEGAPPVSPVATATRTATPGVVQLAGTPTRTPSPTKTATSTRTPTVTPLPTATPIALSFGGLTNGGFEDVDADVLPLAWKTYGGEVTSVTLPARSGTRAARFESESDSTKWLYQTVGLNGDQSYVFSAWIWSDDAGVLAAYLRVSWYASYDGGGSAISQQDSTSRLETRSPAWRFVTTDAVVAPPGARSARLRVMFTPVSAARAAIVVDDASFGIASPGTPPNDAGAGLAGPDEQEGPGGSTGASRTRRGAGTVASATADRATAGARIVINEVLYDAAGDGADAAGEWVELYNTGEAPVTLAGWTIADASGADVLPDFTLEPSEFVIVASSDSPVDTAAGPTGRLITLGGRIGNGLGNDSDAVLLVDASGATVDAVSWGHDTSAFEPSVEDVPAGHSIERRIAGRDSDTAGDWVDNDRPSPGSAYVTEGGPRGPGASGSGLDIAIRHGGEGTPWWVWALLGGSTGALGLAVAGRVAPVMRARLMRSP